MQYAVKDSLVSSMNSNELKEILKESATSLDAYSIGERAQDESLVLTSENGRWVVFYFERGQRTQEASFDDETQACAHFLDRIMQW